MSELSQAQLDARSKGLGGSDAAVVCGLSKWKTPVELWQEKSGIIDPPDLDNDELVRWGKLLEDVICEEWARRTGRKVRRQNQTRTDPEFEFMVANIDRDIVGVREGFEAKNASAWTAHLWGDDETDEVPLYYLTQGIHYMRVYDYEAWNFGVLLGGNELRKYRIERDEKAEQALIEIEAAFWEHVRKGEAPDPVNVEDLVRIYPHTRGRKVATEEIATLVAEAQRAKDEIKEREKRVDEIKLEVGKFLGEAEELLAPNDATLKIATFRNIEQKRLDGKRLKREDPLTYEAYVTQSTYRRFEVK